MVKLPEFISYLKVRGSYTEVGAPVSRSGLTPGTVTTPIVGGEMCIRDRPLMIYSVKIEFAHLRKATPLLDLTL